MHTLNPGYQIIYLYIYIQIFVSFCLKVAIILGAPVSLASQEMWEVIEFEKLLANISLDEAERHDTGQWYNKAIHHGVMSSI